MFEEILKDSKTYTDDMKITLGDKEVSLGDIRKLTSAQQEKVTQHLKDAQADRERAAALAKEAEGVLNNLRTAQQTVERKEKVEASPDEFETEAYWEPVRKRLTAEQAERNRVEDQLKQLTGTITNAVTIWSRERWQNQYDRVQDRLKKSDQYKDWDVDRLIKYAADNKKLDSFGLPSIEAAVSELTKVNEQDEIRKNAYEEGLRKGRTEGRLNLQNRPTSAAGGRPRQTPQLDPNQNLNDLPDVVMADDDLNEMLASLGALGPVDFNVQ
jgi:hypothetical protein